MHSSPSPRDGGHRFSAKDLGISDEEMVALHVAQRAARDRVKPTETKGDFDKFLADTANTEQRAPSDDPERYVRVIPVITDASLLKQIKARISNMFKG